MAIAIVPEPTAAVDADGPAALTPRGRAVARLLAFEAVWAELDGADRAYFTTELEGPTRQARQVGGTDR